MIDVVIVGSGFAGLGAAIALTGDVQSHLYSFSFAPNPHLTRTFARQPEIRAYLENVADRYRLRDRIRFGAEVSDAEWDGASWARPTARPCGRVSSCGRPVRCTSPVPRARGASMHPPGTVFHSARWNHEHDLEAAASGGCASWYLDAQGPNRTLRPGYTFDFRGRTRRIDPADHELIG